jgi:signal transduction histidine kinase
MHKASGRLLELVNDILDLATLEAGYLTLQREDMGVYNLMTSVKDLVSDWARKASIEVHLTCAKNIGKITADEKRMKQAIINVIRNAINFTPEGGKITLAAKKRKDGIEISVEDTGIGIPKEDKNIVALHGGHVDLESEEDVGTTVTMFIPFTSIETEFKVPISKKKPVSKKLKTAEE